MDAANRERLEGTGTKGADEPFVWSDAWLLLSILYGCAPMDREEIIRCGDAINHAIFLPAELEGGFGRLIAAGLVVEQEGRFAASPAVRGWFDSSRGKRGTVRKHMDSVKRYLGVC